MRKAPKQKKTSGNQKCGPILTAAEERGHRIKPPLVNTLLIYGYFLDQCLKWTSRCIMETNMESKRVILFINNRGPKLESGDVRFNAHSASNELCILCSWIATYLEAFSQETGGWDQVSMCFGIREDWVQISALSLASYVSLGELLLFHEAWSPDLCRG